jgi:hypothetical protein
MNKRNLLTLGDEFLEYCRLNDIKDVEKLAKETFQRGFTILKYGETPYGIKGNEKIVEKEVIKEVTVTDNVENERLREEISKLKEENNKMNEALNKFNKATFMKNSDMNTLYGE